MREKKYAQLLANPDVRRWYENVARGSRVTADVYLRRLGSFCSQYNLEPDSILAMDEVRLRNLLMDFISSNEEKYAGSYIKSTLKSVRS